MNFENTRIFNFEGAFRGMRNPLNSWNKSDSYFGIDNWDGYYSEIIARSEEGSEWRDYLEENSILDISVDRDYVESAIIGKADLELAKKLCKAGAPHRKFLRQIFVSVDITLGLHQAKELDTYCVGVTKNSCSTMHKLKDTPIDFSCFETLDYNREISGDFFENQLIPYLENLRLKYLETKDIRYWKELIRLLPESWLQKRTYTLNYEVIRKIVEERTGHKLKEWELFIDWAKTLPYSRELIFE